jgi:hypothetical protein
MKQLFSAKKGTRQLPKLALALGLLAAAPAAAQAPATIYALGTATQAFAGFAAGSQLLAQVNPATQTFVPGFLTITNVAADQRLVGIDVRPSTGQLFALGYNSSTGVAQVYTINTSTALATPVGGTITLNLQDTNRSNTRGVITNVGFDFNPRVDRIRVVAPNGTNYRLNPNTGGIAATDGSLTYVTGNTVGHAPYIGTAAYTNSVVNIPGTTLYDLDITNTNGLLSTQGSPNPNDGVLNPVTPVTFAVNGSTTYVPLASPTIGLSLDIAYDRSARTNLAYLLEARYSNDPIVNDRFATNFYSFDLATGKATGKNLFGSVPVFLYDIAAAVSLPKTWTGAVSRVWEDDGNWSPAGAPNATDDVFIPGTSPNQPIVGNTAGTKQALSVTLGIGAVLTTADGGTLNVYGSFANNDGSVTGTGTGTVALVGTARQDIGGNAVSAFQNLSVGTAGATTSGPTAVVRALTVSGNLAIGTGQAFTLRSNSTGTAYVVNNNGALVTGTATVQRYITPTNNGSGARHYSTPVSGNTVADFAATGFTPVINPAYNTSATPPTTTPFPTIFTYDQSRLSLTNSSPEFDKGFLSPNATSDPIATATGYTVNVDAGVLIDFQGTLNTGTYTRANLARGPQATAGWQFLGNPYPGAINYDVVLANSTGIESALFVYKSNGQYTGTYTSYVNGLGSNTGTSNLPVAQGFFVRTAPGQTGTVNFTNAARTNAPETAPFERTAADSRPTLAFTLRNASIANQARVYFEQGATASFDEKFDAHYLPATHGLDLASDISTEALAINGLPELKGVTTVPLKVHAPKPGTYTLAVDELINLPAGYRAYLRDANTGTYTDLTTTPSVSLTLAPSEAATGRFALLFTAASPLATAPAALAALAAVYPSPAHGTATLVLPQALRGTSASTVQLLNSLGQVVLSKTVAAGSGVTVELPLAGVAAGIYMVRATTEAGLVAKRLVVQ